LPTLLYHTNSPCYIRLSFFSHTDTHTHSLFRPLLYKQKTLFTTIPYPLASLSAVHYIAINNNKIRYAYNTVTCRHGPLVLNFESSLPFSLIHLKKKELSLPSISRSWSSSPLWFTFPLLGAFQKKNETSKRLCPKSGASCSLNVKYAPSFSLSWSLSFVLRSTSSLSSIESRRRLLILVLVLVFYVRHQLFLFLCYIVGSHLIPPASHIFFPCLFPQLKWASVPDFFCAGVEWGSGTQKNKKTRQKKASTWRSTSSFLYK
jgi:hypothetical protein